MASRKSRTSIQRVASILAVAFTMFAALPVAAQTASQVTFSKDVAPILQAKCQECHQPNSIAPMSLITYKDVRPWARSIKQRVAARQMPPWHIEPNVGVQRFKNDMSLTTQQIETIVQWVDAGAPEGDPKDLPPAKPLATDTSRATTAPSGRRIGSGSRSRLPEGCSPRRNDACFAPGS